MEEIKKFYSKLKFPGMYTIQDLEFYDDVICNDYLNFYNNAVIGCKSVLDVGCGSGFILNFLARKYPNIHFDAVDFSDSIDYSIWFSKQHQINNITYHKIDFLEWKMEKQFDLVISNGVIHHIPQYNIAIEKIKKLSSKKIAIGIYNSYGKLLKKIIPINYISDVLYADQEKCPFEISFVDVEFRQFFLEYSLLKIYPSCKNYFVNFYNLFNYKNGGLTIYLFSLD